MKALCCKIILPLLFVLAATISQAQLSVDINNSGRPLTEGNDPAYTPWSTNQSWFTGGDVASNTFEGVTVTFTRVGTIGTGLKPSYWKSGVQSTAYNVKLTADGIKVDSGDTGGEIEMRISGLSAGSHTLLTYHNVWDGFTPGTVSPLDVSVDGVKVITNLVMSVRVTNNADAATAYLNLNAVAGQDVVVLFQAETNGSYSATNVYLNGFEIDTPDSTLKAIAPTPQNFDEHVDADSGSLSLTWVAAGSAVSHDVYFGTSSNAVQNANHASGEFKGNQTATSYAVSNLSSLLKYYWRVDEVNSTNGVIRGDLWYFRSRHLAFPGAEGYGRFARGGRGGVVVEVTNLNDNGPGSLRDALTGDYGPRTVVFTVSGLITLQSPLTIDSSNPYTTVAGQTAPGKGICVKNYVFGMSGASDVIFRDMRIRVGKDTGLTQNASGMAGVNYCIMDHCSISWGIDEEISSRGSKNFTLQRTLISEALNIAGHQNYPAGTEHGYAASVGGDIGSLHHNLLAHNEGRNWSLAGGLDGSGYYAGRLDIFNNVVYNWGSRATDGGAHEVNFVNNYYKPGAGTDFYYALNAQYDAFPGTQQYYFAGNVMPGHFQTSNETAGREATDGMGTVPTAYSPWVSAPFFPSYATIDEVTNAYKKVLSDVGCTEPVVDDHDVRVIRETIDGTYAYTGTGPYGGRPGMPNSTADIMLTNYVVVTNNGVLQTNVVVSYGWEDYGNEVRPADWDTDHDGLPNWWELIKGLNTNSPSGDFSDANADLVGDGYTELDRYINWMAEPHYDCTNAVDVDLTCLSRGFTNSSPVYAISGVTNGTVSLIGGSTAHFVSTANSNALGSFTYTVTDAKGCTMTQTVGIHIVTASLTNTAPILSPVSDQVINVGMNLSITNTATDDDAPAQTLTFSLPAGPVNATLGASSGIFNWRPLVTQADTTNTVTVVVADNGTPSLSATQTFRVVVNPLILPTIASPGITGREIALSVNGQVGPDYAVQRSTNLNDWETLLITNPSVMPFHWSATNASDLPLQFYRIKVGPPWP